jgi:hypothetical protein
MSSTDRIPHLPYKYGETTWEEHLYSIHAAVVDVERAQRENTNTISAGFDDLQRTLNWGFTLLHDQMETQRRLFKEIAERLRAIEETLKAPTLTLAREAFALGRQHIRQGLLVKGLEQLTRAEELYDVDFLLHLQIGKVRLYGRNSDESVVDVDTAEKHLLLARRYAHAATIDLKEKVNFFVGDACYHLAVLKYLRSSDRFQAHDQGSAHDLLKEAISVLAAIPTPLPEHRFFEARCQCLLGETKAAYEILVELCDPDRKFALVAREEPDFAALAEVVRDIPGILRATPGPATARAFAARDEAVATIEQARDANKNAEVQRALDELNASLQATDPLLDIGGIDTAAFTKMAESTTIKAIEYAKRGYDEQRRGYDERLKRLQGRLHELGVPVQPVSPFSNSAFPLQLLFLFVLAGVGASILSGIFEIFSDKSESWRRGLWISTTLLLVALCISGMHADYLRNRRKATALEERISSIRETIQRIEAEKARLGKA